jgi:outer membrane protein assembly factor BamB
MRRLCAFLALVVIAPVQAEDWPQWLGPRRDGSSAEKVAPWKEAPKILWRVKVGEGHSSPVVAGGKVYLHTKVKAEDAEELTAYDAVSGKPAWSKTYPRGKFSSVFGLGPRGTPAVVNGRVYTFGVTGILACWDADKGDGVWMNDTKKNYSPPALRFGVSCSPLVLGPRVLVNVGAKGASVVAFDRDNGKEVWKSLDDPASYSSPVAIGEGASRQVIFLTAKGLRSLNPADGKLFWEVPLVDLLNESSTTPVKVDELVLASSVTFGSLGVQLKEQDQKPAASQKWKNAALTCYFSTPVPVGQEHVYLITGSAINPFNPTSTLHCVEAKTGKELWKKENVAKYHAALLRTADDKLLMLDDFGNLKLLDPSPKEYRELATAKVCRPTWAHPALAEGRLYLRDDTELICVQLREGK